MTVKVNQYNFNRLSPREIFNAIKVAFQGYFIAYQ